MSASRLPLAVFSLLLLALSAPSAVRYVDVRNANPMPPYTNWFSAATTLQDAVDASSAGDEVVVSDGIYQTGGRIVFGSLTNRVAVTKALMLRSVNGPVVTVIQGYQSPGATNGPEAVRCVYLTNGATLIGFTLTGGATSATGDYMQEESGGGVWCASTSATVSNCVLEGNSAAGGAGGASSGTLNFCTLRSNSAGLGGGVAFQSKVNNCTLDGNQGYNGGGAYDCALNNCALTRNISLSQRGAAYYGTLKNCSMTGNSASVQGGGASQALPSFVCSRSPAMASV